MKIEFANDKISIQAAAASWGPFSFDFEPGLPGSRTLVSCTVKSYLGRVKPDDSDILSTFTETTSELIDTASVSISSDYIVGVYFNRPTTEAYINQKHTLVFEFTMDAAGGGGVHTAFFYSVEVL